MRKALGFFCTLVATLGFGAACTVHQQAGATLAGPSELALSLRVTATPDSISQDGGSQSSIVVTALDPNGKGIAGLPVRLDMVVGGVVQDFGTLSARTIVIDANGRGTATYTAPPAPPANLGGSGTRISILATPTGNNAQASQSQSTEIRLVPPGEILPPAGTPTAKFTFSPTSPVANLATLFDASTSCATQSACTSTAGITSFEWSFGDGTASATGQKVSHTFTLNGAFNVTLTVTNDRTISSSSTQAITVAPGANPTADFVFSPTAPLVNQSVNFDASQARPGLGHSIASYNWNFGDGTSGGGIVVSHGFGSAGTFNVVLTVTDEVGQSVTVTKAVTVGSASTSAPVANFQVSPLSPGINQDVFFNAKTSTAGSGRTITSYTWDFGDGGTASGVTATHQYSRTASFTAILVVTDDLGQRATASQIVNVSAVSGAIVADFVFSPTDPHKGTPVFFDATASSSPSGIASYIWDFGDGTPGGTGQKPTNHPFANAQTYVVRLTVTDNAGRTATTTKLVTVSP